MGVWSDLLFGEGFFLGLILINSILFVMSSIVKSFGYLAGCFSALMFLVYIQEMSTLNQIETFGIIFQAILCLIYFYIAYEK